MRNASKDETRETCRRCGLTPNGPNGIRKGDEGPRGDPQSSERVFGLVGAGWSCSPNTSVRRRPRGGRPGEKKLRLKISLF